MRTSFRMLVALVATGLLSTSPAMAQSEDFEFEDPVRLKAGDELIKTEAPGYACPALADLDGDGLKDLLVGQFSGGKIMIYPNLGKAGFGEGEFLKADGEVAMLPGVW